MSDECAVVPPSLTHSLPLTPPTHSLLQCSPSDSTSLWHFWKVRRTFHLVACPTSE